MSDSADLFQTPRDSDSSGPRRVPHVAFVPQHYEPGYAYPLLVLLHGRGGDERQLVRLMPRLSRRNYVAVGLRGPQQIRARRDGSLGYGWGQAGRGAGNGEGAATLYRPRLPTVQGESLDQLCDDLDATLNQARRRFNIHPGRIYLVGYGEGASPAYRLGLSMPDRFAGVIAVNGWLYRPLGPFIRWPDARRLRVLILHGRNNRLVPCSAAEQAYRLLYTAGIDVNLQLFDTDHHIDRRMLALVDQWVMQSVATAV